MRGKGAKIVVVPPEQSADLRDYYSKHTKNDRLDSRVLAKLPLLHAEGLTELDDALGPADPLKRAVRRRSDLDIGVTAPKVLERCANPRKLRDLGVEQLTEFLAEHSRGHWRQDEAEALLAAAAQSVTLWAAGELDFDELAEDIASVVAPSAHTTLRSATTRSGLVGTRRLGR